MKRRNEILFYILATAAWTMLTASTITAQKRTASQPVKGSHQAGVPDSVILTNADAPSNVKRLHVLHSYTLSDLSRQPVLRFTDRQVNLAPLLNSPRSLPNMAARLQAATRYIKVLNTSSTASEVEQGVVIESDLQFTFAGGTCGEAAARAAVDQMGVHCPLRVPPPNAKGSSNLDAMVPMSHSTLNANAALRAKYAAYYKQQDTQITQHIAALRAALKDPGKRAQLVASVGQDKVDQITALTDDQIKDNIASTVVQHVHETIYVPKTAMTRLPPGLNDLGSQPAKPNLSAPVSTSNTPDQVTKQPLGPDIYLTGFTIGNQWEWEQDISFTIDPCLLGLDVLTDGLASVIGSIFGISPCPFHASLTPYASLSIGFGMRFPIKTNMQYTRTVSSKNSKNNGASVTVDFAPYEASADELTNKNGPALDKAKLFNAQEFVAEIVPTAGIRYDLPILGSDDLAAPLPSLDLTTYLPSPFTGGRFTPPAPNSVLNSDPIPITAFDLFGNLFDLVILQATLNPVVEVGLRSHGLTFDLVDKKNPKAPTDPAGGHITHLTRSGTAVPLNLDPMDHSTDFLLTNPDYNVGLEITPGLMLHLGVDFGVWATSWDPTMMIPQLAIDVPSQGINFACHANTICTHEYQQLGNQAAVSKVTPAQVTKNIQAQGCDGPGSDNQFYCRSNAAWDYCLAHVSSTSYSGCGLDSEDQLNQVLTTLSCPNGYCLSLKKQMTVFGCPDGQAQCSKETNLQTCSRIVADPGMKKFGYQRCCLDPEKNPGAGACSTGHRTAQPPVDLKIIKLVQTQCDGPSDTHEFYCRSVPATTFCQNHAAQMPSYSCGAYIESALETELTSMGCPKGYCRPGADIGVCQNLISPAGYKAFGYTRCCPAPTTRGKTSPCVSNPDAAVQASGGSVTSGSKDTPGGSNSGSQHAPPPQKHPDVATPVSPPPPPLPTVRNATSTNPGPTAQKAPTGTSVPPRSAVGTTPPANTGSTAPPKPAATTAPPQSPTTKACTPTPTKPCPTHK